MKTTGTEERNFTGLEYSASYLEMAEMQRKWWFLCGKITLLINEFSNVKLKQGIKLSEGGKKKEALLLYRSLCVRVCSHGKETRESRLN